MLVLECESVRALQECKYSILSCAATNSHTDQPGGKGKKRRLLVVALAAGVGSWGWHLLMALTYGSGVLPCGAQRAWCRSHVHQGTLWPSILQLNAVYDPQTSYKLQSASVAFLQDNWEHSKEFWGYLLLQWLDHTCPPSYGDHGFQPPCYLRAFRPVPLSEQAWNSWLAVLSEVIQFFKHFILFAV